MKKCIVSHLPDAQIQITTPEGMRIWKPMWLIIMGQRRLELTTTAAYYAYRQRYDIEHLLRFGQQRLSVDGQVFERARSPTSH